MTRDDVLEECFQIAHREVQAATTGAWDDTARGRANSATYIRQQIAALKSKPPEKSPEVECAGCAAYREAIKRHDRDEAGSSAREMDRTDAAEERARVAETERDSLKAQLEATERRAAEAIARVEALTAEVQHREWVERGAPMQGEAETVITVAPVSMTLACAHGRTTGLCPWCAGVNG